MKRAKERDSSETAAIKINRRKVCLLIIAIGISVLLLITMLGLLHLEKSNTRRYREENHARFDANTQAFQEVLDSSDAWIDNLKTSIYALPYLETASAADFLADLKQPGVKLTFDESPFPTDKNGNKLLGRLQGLIMASSSFSESAIYNPQTGVAVACVSNGHVGALCTEEEELCALLGISSLNTEEGALTEGRAAEHANAALYLTRVLDDGLVLLCGVTHEALNDSLLADSSGRSYLLKQMVCVFPDGGLLLRDPSRSLGTLGLTQEELTRDASIEDIGDYTLMRHTLPEYGLQTVAILAETGATSVVSSEWIWLLLIVTALWLLVITAVGVYMLIRVFRPLSKISSSIAPDAETTEDDLQSIANAIQRYNQQLLSNQATIEAQLSQLRRAYLEQLALGQTPLITPEQSERLGIPKLLEKYMLIVLYPDNGRWMRENGSEQENLYRKHIMVNTVEESIRTQMKDVQAEFLMCQFALLVVVPVKDETENMAKAVERWTMDLSVQLQKRFRFGVSPVQSGAESLHPAYRKVMQSAALVEEKESGRSQDICLNTLIRQNLHMSELVYMEHYNSAFACFKEMADTLYQQKSRRLRNQQLSGLMSLTLCMLMETSSENNALLQEAGIDIGALTQPEDDEAELLAEWEKVFGLLEAHQDKRIRGQYSEQFASIYQYMHAHFRDSGLSLTALAEEFGMSVSTLSREFQKNLGQGFLDSLHQMRIEEAKYAIENTNASLNDIAISVGYTNTLTMTRAFKKYLGCTPGSFRKKEDIS